MHGIIFHEEADTDLIEQAVFIGKENAEAAERFLQEAEKAFALLAEMPRLGSVFISAHPRFGNLRTWRIHGFEQHLIFYLVRENSIEIIRVLHAKRDIDAALEGG